MSLSNKYGDITTQRRENDLQVAERLVDLLIRLSDLTSTPLRDTIAATVEATLVEVVDSIRARENA